MGGGITNSPPAPSCRRYLRPLAVLSGTVFNAGDMFLWDTQQRIKQAGLLSTITWTRYAGRLKTSD